MFENINLKIDKNSKIVKYGVAILLLSFARKLGLWGGLILVAAALYIGIVELDTFKEMFSYLQKLFS